MPLATITDFLCLKNTLQNTNYSSKTIQKNNDNILYCHP